MANESLLPFAPESHPIWSPFAEEIHTAVWGHVGLEVVRAHVRTWAEQYRGDLERHEQALREYPQAVKEYDAERERLGQALKRPFPRAPGPEPELPLPPPEDHKPSLAGIWAALSAIHDYFWKGEKINPLPQLSDRYPVDELFVDKSEAEAQQAENGALLKWLRETGPYHRLVQQVAHLSDDDRTFIARWLKDAIEGLAAGVAEVSEKEPFGFPLPPPQQKLTEEEVESQEDTRHSEDFSYVYWYGSEHYFTKTQAECVKVLWGAWESKTFILKEETIFERAGSEGSRLRDVFKTKNGMHRAWGSMIIPAGKGSFRLQEPEKSQPPGKPQENPT